MALSVLGDKSRMPDDGMLAEVLGQSKKLRPKCTKRTILYLIRRDQGKPVETLLDSDVSGR